MTLISYVQFVQYAAVLYSYADNLMKIARLDLGLTIIE